MRESGGVSIHFNRTTVDGLLTSNNDELLRLQRDDFLLEQTGPAAFDQVEFVIDLVRAVEGNIQLRALGEHIEVDGVQSGGQDQLFGLEARGDEFGLRGVEARLLDGLDDVDDGAAAADSDPLGIFGIVVFDGDLAGSALCGFDVGHDGCEAGTAGWETGEEG